MMQRDRINILNSREWHEWLEHLLGNSNIDFLGLIETWLTHTFPEAVITMHGNNVFRKRKKERKNLKPLIGQFNTIHQIEQFTRSFKNENTFVVHRSTWKNHNPLV